MRRNRLKRPSAAVLGGLVLAAAMSGCRSVQISIPDYAVMPAPRGERLLAGAAAVDITPPAGYPMGGHSLAGRIARGHWMRLYARAFYFRDREGGSIALVSCDLFAIPAGLQQMVAARLHMEEGGERRVEDISSENLLIAATHTHQSPGNYMSSAFYNNFASPYPGFDPDLFRGLSGKIAEAVRKAVQDAESHPEGASLSVWNGRVEEVARNRSVHAFGGNAEPEKEAILRAGPAAPTGCAAPCPRYRAIDPTVTVLEIRRPAGATTERAALLVFYAVHPTVMAHDTPLFSPDLVGRAMRQLERRSGERGVIAGFFNGAEGDVSPRWHRRDAEETRCLGDRLAEAVERILATGAPLSEDGADARVAVRNRAVARTAFCEGTWPMMGVAALGGAEDGRFVTYDLGWRAPHARPTQKKKSWLARLSRSLGRNPKQAPKQPALDFEDLPWLQLTSIVAPPRHFPSEVAVSLIQLGRLSIATVPVEMTTAMGVALRNRLAPLQSGRHVVLVGLANEYWSYAATRSEYHVQDYEGASSLFGPATGECYVRLLEEAARQPPVAGAKRIASVGFQVGPAPPLKARFGPGFWGSIPPEADQEFERPFAESTCLPPAQWPRFEWKNESDDEKTALLGRHSATWMVEEEDDDSHLVTVLSDGTGGVRTWNTLWVPEAGHDERSLHVIQVKTRGSPSRLLCSAPFSLEGIRTGAVPLPLPAASSCP